MSCVGVDAEVTDGRRPAARKEKNRASPVSSDSVVFCQIIERQNKRLTQGGLEGLVHRQHAAEMAELGCVFCSRTRCVHEFWIREKNKNVGQGQVDQYPVVIPTDLRGGIGASNEHRNMNMDTDALQKGIMEPLRFGIETKENKVSRHSSGRHSYVHRHIANCRKRKRITRKNNPKTQSSQGVKQP